MRLVIKPEQNKFNLIVEAEAYRQAWQQNARKIRQAYRDVVGLDFNQAIITAYVYDGRRSFSGYYRKPMRLEAGGASPEVKLLVLIHELSHRLLGGNSLAINNDLKLSQLDEHKRIYLFEYDVVLQALGKSAADRLEFMEDRVEDKDYSVAWRWAMAMTFGERQHKLEALRQKAKPYRNIVVRK